MRELKSQMLSDPEYLQIAERWQSLDARRVELGTELEQLSREFPGEMGHHLKSIRNWLKDSRPLDELIRRPDVLSFCLSLFRSPPGMEDERQVSLAAREGLKTLTRGVLSQQRWLRKLVYPLLICCAVGALILGYSFWISPIFEEMFADFGIELPVITRWVLQCARAIREWAWLAGVVIGSLLLTGWYLNRDRERPFRQGWLDQQLRSGRNTAANWAWHVALLQDLGFKNELAIQTAGEASGQAWVRKRCGSWLEQTRAGGSPPLFFSRKLQLLNSIVLLPRSEGQTMMLREAADHYWDLNQGIGDWWIQLVVYLIIWVVAAGIIILVLSLFAPLFAIVSGMTG